MAKNLIKTKPEIVFVDVTDERKVELSWRAAEGATDYNIERYNREKDKFVKIGSVKADVTKFTCAEKLPDGVYQYRINALKTVEEGKRPISRKGAARAVNLSSIPAVEITKIESPSFGKVKITWQEDKNALGYVINRRLEDMNESVSRGESEKGVLSFTDDTAVSGQVYYYDVQSFVLDKAGERVFSNTGKEECFVCLDKTKIFETKRGLSKKVSFSFRMTAGVSFYVLFKGETKDGEFKEVARTENSTTLSLHDKGERGERSACYFIRCCRVMNGKEIFGPKSEIVLVKYR